MATQKYQLAPSFPSTLSNPKVGTPAKSFNEKGLGGGYYAFLSCRKAGEVWKGNDGAEYEILSDPPISKSMLMRVGGGVKAVPVVCQKVKRLTPLPPPPEGVKGWINQDDFFKWLNDENLA